MTSLPPLGGITEGLRCTRLLHWPDESSRCPNDAAVHVMWTDDGENGLCCTEHLPSLEGLTHVDLHDYDPICSVGGAIWIFGKPSFCVVDELPALAEHLARHAVKS